MRGEYLCRIGDAAGEIYVIQSGEVKDAVVNGDGEEVVHFVHGPGMTLGEAGFFSVERHGVVKDRALEGLASNTRWQTAMISTLTTRTLVNRLLMRLLELVDSSRENVNRALALLVAQGYVRRMDGRYVLVDEAGLRNELARDLPLVGRPISADRVEAVGVGRSLPAGLGCGAVATRLVEAPAD